ncbi:MAG: NUDIX hydrolase [Deltaproteobacteria bacterium]|nr:NUDIX hydrolase [Deltaproteobacteria bacterium]MBW2417477.1 NUDIX hydrolase [Deltaproteobacteria bacterium]
MPADPRLAATLVLLRDADPGPEVLLVRRSPALAYHGGDWVFPGGHVDPEDRETAADGREALEIARVAAVREAREEAGVRVGRASTLCFAEWTTPEVSPTRFRTWYFAARWAGDPVVVDETETVDHRWLRPAQALDAQATGELSIPPPTYVTLSQLAACGSVAEALAQLGVAAPAVNRPRIIDVPGGHCSVCEEDSAYAGGDFDRPGPRRRLWMLDSGWHCEWREG